MKKYLFSSLLFAAVGYLFSCFLVKIGGELPLAMHAADYRFVFLNPLALPYALMGLGFGALLTLILNSLLRKFIFIAE
ncbi:hypothetical protein L9G74_01865 [Shewanella sp. C32]|uniref:Lipopolysaccharide assembly protein A domain-containing protein n=1 Tax=Shewanella electrica TaxID=515560 RepID=A0ABT2FG50_9GAMM|nr:hypothetical protein [Shewanella electrica]MCH1925351.1 hypothetical protein [Shewanella electrica]MCS4555176.1 hypothetical protein [Shewanella electrica]